MLAKPDGCRGCPLEFLGTGFARTDGTGSSGILVVAEALGEEEADKGLPLVGQTGQLFNRMLSRITDPTTGQPLHRDQFLLSNVVNCRPPNNHLVKSPYEQGAVDHCRPYLEETIRRFKPKAILAMGATALRWFTGYSTVKEWRGYIVETEWGPVIPTYHPSFLLQGNFSLCEVWQFDMLRALHVARNGVKRMEVTYAERPSPLEAMRWLDDFRAASPTMLSFDIETPYSRDVDESEALDKSDLLIEEDDPSYTIVRISFSWKAGTAITLPWCPPYIEVAKAFLQVDGPKAVWNEAYDVPRLIANGAPIRGPIYDFMHAFHMIKPHIPYRLKYVATFYTDLPQWAHESADRQEWYSCVDADATIRCAAAIEKEAQKAGKWRLFERHFVELGAVLREMSDAGIPLHMARRRLARMRMTRDMRLLQAKLNQAVPQELRKVTRYKISPEQVEKKGLLAEGEWVEWDDGKVDPMEKMPCGHPRKQTVTSSEGTSFCKGCEKEARKREKTSKAGTVRRRKPRAGKGLLPAEGVQDPQAPQDGGAHGERGSDPRDLAAAPRG